MKATLFYRSKAVYAGHAVLSSLFLNMTLTISIRSDGNIKLIKLTLRRQFLAGTEAEIEGAWQASCSEPFRGPWPRRSACPSSSDALLEQHVSLRNSAITSLECEFKCAVGQHAVGNGQWGTLGTQTTLNTRVEIHITTSTKFYIRCQLPT